MKLLFLLALVCAVSAQFDDDYSRKCYGVTNTVFDANDTWVFRGGLDENANPVIRTNNDNGYQDSGIGWIWDWYYDEDTETYDGVEYVSGAFDDGTNDFFDDALYVYIDNQYYIAKDNATYGNIKCFGNESFTIGPHPAPNGLVITRNFWIPVDVFNSSYVRVIDSFTNPTNAPIVFNYTSYSEMGSDGDTRFYASATGNLPPTNATNEFWWVSADSDDADLADGDDPSAAFVWGNAGAALGPSSALTNDSDEYYTYFWLSVPAGKTVQLMYFVSQSSNIPLAVESANFLATPSAQTLKGLQGNDFAKIKNWNLCSNALSSLYFPGAVTVTSKCTVTATSAFGTFNYQVKDSSDSVVASGTSASDITLTPTADGVFKVDVYFADNCYIFQGVTVNTTCITPKTTAPGATDLGDGNSGSSVLPMFALVVLLIAAIFA